jgi:hypothetical protein
VDIFLLSGDTVIVPKRLTADLVWWFWWLCGMVMVLAVWIKWYGV